MMMRGSQSPAMVPRLDPRWGPDTGLTSELERRRYVLLTASELAAYRESAMSFNATRLTCFALISAIETDCREAILAADADHELVWPTAAQSAALGRMERERLSPGDGIDLLVQYLDFADAYQVLLANRTSLSASLRESLDAVASRLEPLIAVRNRVAHSRPMEIGDLSLSTDIAEELTLIAPGEWSTTLATLSRLKKEPAFVLGLTVELPTDPLESAQHNLPIPDFDETGFLGRNTELRRIKKALLGAYPVVSILGDGGIGKTAVALKVAYDLLDSPESPFEAIVWATAKSNQLANTEITAINDAIQDSLGLFEAAASELAGFDAISANPIDDVLDYLAQFKILLILDNLETVTDKRIREFLLDLPLGSKVLLTSRIGLGIENPVMLEPLTADESKRLLKTLAGIRSVDVLKQMDDESVSRLVSKLRGHPLYIKWVVAGVQAGRRPSELVDDNSLVLDFCMSNVWDKLSAPARAVLQGMQVARGQRNLGELAYLLDIAADRVQEAILELMTTNFVSMKYSAVGTLDGAYETGEFASQYLNRQQPPSPGLRSRVAGRARELEELGRTLVAESRSNPYDAFAIDIRDRADVPTARLLRLALRSLQAGEYDKALTTCEDARTLSPTYGEVWRIRGLVNSYRSDLNAAEHDYSRALEYADKSAVMAFHVAGFYLELAGDPHLALEAVNNGLRANPTNPLLLFKLAQVHFALGRYLDAVAACSILGGAVQGAVGEEHIALLLLRAAVFGAESLLWNGNYGGTAELIEESLSAIDKIGTAGMDERSADWLVRLRILAQQLAADAAKSDFLARRAGEYEQAITQKVRSIDPSRLHRLTGQIAQIVDGKRFGFIRNGQQRYFFHRNDLVDKDEWNDLEVNSIVAFDIGSNARGASAVRVRALV